MSDPIVIQLTDEQIEKIADRVFERIYLNVGKSALKLGAWVIGIGATALMAWLGGKGLLK
jgi:hypothetical protein